MLYGKHTWLLFKFTQLDVATLQAIQILIKLFFDYWIIMYNTTSIGSCAIKYPVIRCRNGSISLEFVCSLHRLTLIKSYGKYKYRLSVRYEMKHHCSFHIKWQHVHHQNQSDIFECCSLPDGFLVAFFLLI